jgi:hypothetical protein
MTAWKSVGIALSLFALSACADLGSKPKPAPMTDTELPAAMAVVFNLICLQMPPADGSHDAYFASTGYTPLTQDEVKTYLHSDPGKGWKYQGLVITLEDPPYRACAVRRMTPSGIATVKPYIKLLDDYAASQHATLVSQPPVAKKGPDGIMDIHAYPQLMLDQNGKPLSLFSVILANYHGRVPPQVAEQAVGGVGVEVRFVRQLVP